MKISKSMTLILMTLGLTCTAIAAILQYKENDKTSNQIISLQDKLIKYSTGGEELPAVLVLAGKDKIALEIVTRDTFPLLNVKVKCRGVILPDLGTVYPRVTTRFFDDTMVTKINSAEYDLVIWYNNTKSLMANVIITRRKNGFFDSRVEYFNSKGDIFEHPYQGKSSAVNQDTTPNVYRPDLHNSPEIR